MTRHLFSNAMLLRRMPGRYSSTVQYGSHALHMNIGLTCAQALFAGDEYRSQYPKCHGGHVRFLEGDTRNQTSLFMKCSVWKNTVIPHFQGLAKYEERRRALNSLFPHDAMPHRMACSVQLFRNRFVGALGYVEGGKRGGGEILVSCKSVTLTLSRGERGKGTIKFCRAPRLWTPILVDVLLGTVSYGRSS